MKIAIIGAGVVGGYLAKAWHDAGHEPFLSFSREPVRLQAKAQDLEIGVRWGSGREAVTDAPVVLLSAKYWVIEEALDQAGSLAGKTVPDNTNPCQFDPQGRFERMIAEDTSAAEVLAGRNPEAVWVKAFSSLQPSALARAAKLPEEARPAVPYATNNSDAARLAEQLIREAGGAPRNIGALDHAKWMEIGGYLAMTDKLPRAGLDKRLHALKENAQ
jgi:predicted dinucleotide-binding enzyme